MPQVVADVETGAGAGGGGQHPVAVVEGDGKRLLGEHGDARFEEEQRGCGVQVVGGQDEDGVEVVREHVLVALVEPNAGAEQRAGVGASPLGRVGTGDHPGRSGPVGQGGQSGALADADHSQA